MNGHLTLEMCGTVWRSNTVSVEEADEIIGKVRAGLFFAPINFRIEFVEDE